MRLRFTIRDLLWLTVVVALAVGWSLNRKQLIAERERWQERAEHPSVVIQEHSSNPEPTRSASQREREKEDYRKQLDPAVRDTERGYFPQ
jgi:hypothetical protein